MEKKTVVNEIYLCKYYYYLLFLTHDNIKT